MKLRSWGIILFCILTSSYNARAQDGGSGNSPTSAVILNESDLHEYFPTAIDVLLNRASRPTSGVTNSIVRHIERVIFVTDIDEAVNVLDHNPGSSSQIQLTNENSLIFIFWDKNKTVKQFIKIAQKLSHRVRSAAENSGQQRIALVTTEANWVALQAAVDLINEKYPKEAKRTLDSFDMIVLKESHSSRYGIEQSIFRPMLEMTEQMAEIGSKISIQQGPVELMYVIGNDSTAATALYMLLDEIAQNGKLKPIFHIYMTSNNLQEGSLAETYLSDWVNNSSAWYSEPGKREIRRRIQLLSPDTLSAIGSKFELTQSINNLTTEDKKTLRTDFERSVELAAFRRLLRILEVHSPDDYKLVVDTLEPDTIKVLKLTTSSKNTVVIQPESTGISRAQRSLQIDNLFNQWAKKWDTGSELERVSYSDISTAAALLGVTPEELRKWYPTKGDLLPPDLQTAINISSNLPAPEPVVVIGTTSTQAQFIRAYENWGKMWDTAIQSQNWEKIRELSSFVRAQNLLGLNRNQLANFYRENFYQLPKSLQKVLNTRIARKSGMEPGAKIYQYMFQAWTELYSFAHTNKLNALNMDLSSFNVICNFFGVDPGKVKIELIQSPSALPTDLRAQLLAETIAIQSEVVTGPEAKTMSDSKKVPDEIEEGPGVETEPVLIQNKGESTDHFAARKARQLQLTRDKVLKWSEDLNKAITDHDTTAVRKLLNSAYVSKTYRTYYETLRKFVFENTVDVNPIIVKLLIKGFAKGRRSQEQIQAVIDAGPIVERTIPGKMETMPIPQTPKGVAPKVAQADVEVSSSSGFVETESKQNLSKPKSGSPAARTQPTDAQLAKASQEAVAKSTDQKKVSAILKTSGKERIREDKEFSSIMKDALNDLYKSVEKLISIIRDQDRTKGDIKP